MTRGELDHAHRRDEIEAWLKEKYPDGVPDTLTVGRKFKSREP